MTRFAILSSLVLVWPVLWLAQPAGAAMEHEEIVARLATGQCVPSYQTRACRKLRRQLRERTR